MFGKGNPMREIHAVTGAFGYSGKYIATRLLEKGHDVITLTNSINRENPFEGKVKAFPYNFDNPSELVSSLKGVSVLYNNYWVRYNHKLFNHSDAVKNGITLLKAAKEAGVRRVVHISITNPSEQSNLEYFKGKALFEKALIELDIPHSILRPTVLFGKEDILINNIAWALRKLPVIGVFGKGDYKLQPIYVDDLAELAVNHGQLKENLVIDAIGPETFTYKGLIEGIGGILGIKRRIIPVPPLIGYLACKIMGYFVNDIMVTREEIDGLMQNLLYVDSPSAGKTKLTDWVKENASSIGCKYTSELERRIDVISEYKSN